MKNISVLTLLAALLLAACRPGVPTNIAIEPSPTILHPSVTRAPDRTPSPALAPQPDNRATARAMLTQAVDHRIQNTSQAATAAVQKMIASVQAEKTREASWTATPTMNPESTPNPAKFDVNTSSFTSTDGKWEARILTAFPAEDNDLQVYLKQLKVYRTNGSQEWTVVNEWVSWNLGYSLPSVFGWSGDGRYLYVVDDVIPDGCQVPGGYHSNLRRVDLQSGEVEEIIENDFFGSLALSPDGLRVIYKELGDVEVAVIDLQSMDVQRIKIDPGVEESDFWLVGKFTWSPDGKRVLFPIIYDNCFPAGSKLLLVDVDQQISQTIIEKDRRTFTVLDWTGPDSAQLVDQDGQHWQLNISTGKLETH